MSSVVAPQAYNGIIRLPLFPVSNERRNRLTGEILQLNGSDPDRVHRLVEELQLARAELITEAPKIAAVSEVHIPKLQSIQKALPAGAAVLEFFRGPGALLTSFLINSSGRSRLYSMDLGSFDRDALITQFRAELKYEIEGVPSGERLLLLLLGELWPDLDDVERLIIVPHGSLHYIPFSALWFKNSGEGPPKLYPC